MIARVDPDQNYLVLEYQSQLEMSQIRISFTKKIKNWHFKSKHFGGKGNGNVLFLKQDNKLPIGLWHELKQVCEKFSFPLTVYGLTQIFDSDYAEDECRLFMDRLMAHNPKYAPRENQYAPVLNTVKYKYCFLDFATSSGKTFVSFCIFMNLFYRKKIKKVLILCPDTGLVIQNYQGYIDFCAGKYNLKMCMVSGESKDRDHEGKNIVIGNFQTLVNMGEDYFKDFDCVIIDEGHRIQSQSVKMIINSCVNARYRIGMSGSVPKNNAEADFYNLLMFTGPIVGKIRKRELIDSGDATNIKVKVMKLNYMDDEYRKNLAMLKYADNDLEGSDIYNFEMMTVRSSKIRLAWIVELINKLPKNAIVFFIDVQNGYGKEIAEKVRISGPKQVYYIDGGVDQSLRDIYKQQMEVGENKVLVTSYDTFSTGKSINNIHYLVAAESRKSDIIISQFLGRGMRLHGDKEFCTVIDVCDDFSIDVPNYQNRNILLKHMSSRIKHYEDEKLEYEIINIDLRGKHAYDTNLNKPI